MDARVKSKGKGFSLTIPEGQLIETKNLPAKQQFTKGQSNFWFATQKNIIYFREGQKKEKSIQIGCNQGKYQHEGIISENIYEIIVRTSLFNSIFGSSGDDFVAVTEESMKLPFEEQPWFIGAVDKGELKDIAEAQTRMFFTRAKGPSVYLHWTTTKRLKNPERPIPLESNDLSSVLPRGEFFLARFNGGQILHRNEALFCRRVTENNLNGAKQIFEQGVDLASPILREPYIFTSYIEDTPIELINEELIMWMIESGVPVDRTPPYFSYKVGEQLIEKASLKCGDLVVEALLKHGVFNTHSVLEQAIERNIPAFRMRIYFESFSRVVGDISKYLQYIQNYRDADYTNRVLVMMAWKFGNEDNLFKLLPKELIKHIISFGVDDDTPWLDYVESLDLTKLRHRHHHYKEYGKGWRLGKLLKLAKIVWHHWDRIEEEDKSYVMERLLCNDDYGYPQCYLNSSFYGALKQSEMKELLSWIIKLSKRHPTRKFLEGSHLLAYILFNSNSSPVLKTLLDSGCVKREWLTSSISIWDRLAYAAIPLSWYAIRATNSNLPGIELLARENLLPEQATIQGHVTGLNAFIKRIYGITPHTETVMNLIQNCRAKSNDSAAL